MLIIEFDYDSVIGNMVEIPGAYTYTYTYTSHSHQHSNIGYNIHC